MLAHSRCTGAYEAVERIGFPLLLGSQRFARDFAVQVTLNLRV
jgi:hypothetical protein